MELYQLRTFMIVAEEKSITRAAKRLFTTPPSISAHIKTLEDEWNVVLFRRTPKGMEITEKGEILRRKAEATLLAAQDLSNHATQLLECLMGSLRVGLNTSATFLRIPQIIEYFQDHQPGVELRFNVRAPGEVIEDLKNQSLDAGFIFGPPVDQTITAHWLANTELAIAGPKKWEAQMVEEDWQTAAKLPWISSNSYCPFQVITDQLFRSRGLEYRRLIHTDDDRTKIELIGAGLGVALLEKTEAARAAATGSAFIWRTEPIRCDLFFARLSNRGRDPLIRALQAGVMSVWGAAAA
jgi:DNA-binding transcriptional LysR family regulator